MSLRSGTRDLRRFRHFAKLATDGTVAAVIEIADGHLDPTDGEASTYVEVTELYPYDFRGVTIATAQRAKNGPPVDLGLVLAELRAKNRVPARG